MKGMGQEKSPIHDQQMNVDNGIIEESDENSGSD